MTLLEIVQGVLSTIDSDEVNSIGDTTESEQVALLAKEVYLNMVSERYWPWERKLVSLEASADSTMPVTMRIPESVNRIEDILYDGTCDEKRFSPITYCEQYDFLALVMTFDATLDNTLTYYLKTRVGDVTTEQQLLCKNDAQPRFWTSFDDTYIVFDSYDASIDDTLQTTKTLSWAESQPTFTVLDNFVPDIPNQFWPLYLNDLRVTASVNLKQAVNAKYAADLRRNKIRLQKSKWRENGKPKSPNFGRT